jgi:hypothetical protein
MAPEEGAPEPVLPEAVLARMEALGEALNDVSQRLQTVSENARNTRRLAVGLTVSLILDVLLTVTVTLLSLSALNQGTVLHQSQLTACSLTNQSRAEQRALWSYLFQQDVRATAKERQREQQLLQYVDKTFAPENCSALYH